jgi:hypothetical protein
MNSQSIYVELEVHLQDFIQWAFNQSHSQDYSNTEILAILGEAWKAQQLLWYLQKQKLTQLETLSG